MNEITLQWLQIGKLLTLVLFSGLYGFGGINNKALRRIVAPLLLTGVIVGISIIEKTYTNWYILYAPLLYGALSVGYGADELKYKIRKRLLTGSLYGISALPIFIPNEAWLLMGSHILFCILSSVILGVFNPTKSARAEETLLGVVICLIPLFTI